MDGEILGPFSARPELANDPFSIAFDFQFLTNPSNGSWAEGSIKVRPISPLTLPEQPAFWTNLALQLRA
jgi:hypothetical protein